MSWRMPADSIWNTPVVSARCSMRVRGLVVERDVVDVELDPTRSKVMQGVLDHRQVPKPEEVHLEQTQRLDAVHVELGHDPLGVVA